MIDLKLSLALMAVAFVVTTLIYPYVLAFARKHNIVDNPSARKLQRVPVPVMGGTAVFIGFLTTVIVGSFFLPSERMFKITSLLFVMYVIGVWDDMKDVSAAFRFLIELLVIWLMIIMLEVELNDFHGFLGIDEIPDMVSVPLSLVAGVGIINAINLIDGVDGYCSTYGTMACISFAIIFFLAGAMPAFTLALITIGSLLPFFFHNVFGKTSKMFLGDGGSLFLGTLFTLFMFCALSSNSPCANYSDDGICLPALVLAILAVPVFDTLKVMIFRVIRGRSPFHPDKTHLHHLFIEMNFSHLATSGIIVLANILIVLALILTWRLGAGVDLQFYIVVALSLLVTWGFYFFMEWHHRQNDGEGSTLYQRWCRRGTSTNLTGRSLWLFIRSIVDERFFGGKQAESSGEDVTQGGSRIDPRIN